MKSKVVLNALALLFAAGAMAQDCTFLVRWLRIVRSFSRRPKVRSL